MTSDLIKGKLVTVDLGQNQASNTYKIFKKIGKTCILQHPLAEECLISKDIKDLNNVPANLQDSTEKCLFYAMYNAKFLGHGDVEDLDALRYVYTIKKTLSNKQLSTLSSLCGKIASRILKGDLENAAQIIKANNALLGNHERMMYNTFKGVINDISKIKNATEKYNIFSLAGFILAQLED